MKFRTVLLMLGTLLALFVVVHVVRWAVLKNSDPSATLVLPRLELAALKVNELSSDHAQIDMRMVLHDPLPFGLVIDSLEYVFRINGEEVLRSTRASRFELDAYDTSHVVLPLSVPHKKVTDLLKRLEQRNVDSVEYAITTTMHTRSPLAKDGVIELNASRRLPLFLLPDITVTDINISDFGLKETDMTTVVTIGNPNKIRFALRELEYEMTVGGGELLNGTLTNGIDIPALDTVTISLPVEVKPGKAIGSVVQLLFKPGAPYHFHLRTRLVSDQPSIDGSLVIIERNGVLRDLKQLALTDR
jgi:LEA14-like dessication related protein